MTALLVCRTACGINRLEPLDRLAAVIAAAGHDVGPSVASFSHCVRWLTGLLAGLVCNQLFLQQHVPLAGVALPGHDGNTNRYHTMAQTSLALLYNDQSCLENMSRAQGTLKTSARSAGSQSSRRAEACCDHVHGTSVRPVEGGGWNQPIVAGRLMALLT